MFVLSAKDRLVEASFPLDSIREVSAEDRKLAISIKRSSPLVAVTSAALHFADTLRMYLAIHARARDAAARGNVDRSALNPELQKDLVMVSAAAPGSSSLRNSPASLVGLAGSSPSERIVQALYAHISDEVDELNFKAGDKILLIEVFDDGWAEGMINGDVGVFPVSYTTYALATDAGTDADAGADADADAELPPSEPSSTWTMYSVMALPLSAGDLPQMNRIHDEVNLPTVTCAGASGTSGSVVA